MAARSNFLCNAPLLKTSPEATRLAFWWLVHAWTKVPNKVRSFPETHRSRQRVEGVISSTDRLIRGHLAIWLNAMLQTEELPAPTKSKRSMLFRGWWSNFGHRCGAIVLGVVFEFHETPTCGVKFREALCFLLNPAPTLYQNNRFDDETDDNIKRFIDFSKVSRCRSELLPGRSLDAWNCVSLIHLLTLNHRKKYLCLSLAFPFFEHVSWNKVSAAGVLKTSLKHISSAYFAIMIFIRICWAHFLSKLSSKHWTSLIYPNPFCSTNTYCTCVETWNLSFTKQG